MATEIELKYQASPALLEQLKNTFPDGYTCIAMTTTYYDTPDGALSARRWTLRHRQEGTRHICTLKTPAPGGARGEWEVEDDSIIHALEPLEALSGLTLPRQPVPVCGARFSREAKLLVMDEFTAELALDSGWLHNGEKVQHFSEIELELKAGSRQAMEAFGRELEERFGLRVQPKSKFARAMALGQEG